jgi:Domain of unknown function (DUF6766)
MKRTPRFLRDNALSLVLFVLFLLCFAGKSVFGFHAFDHDRSIAGLAPLGYGRYLATGTFLDAILSNWQAAILQLAALIILSEFLRQRGAAHSRRLPVAQPRSRGRGRKGRRRQSWVYRNSLFLAFLLLFLAAFVGHLLSGMAADNEARALLRQPPIGLAAFFLSAKFWSSTFETWQAEFMAIALFVVLTIFLRQENSPESKPVGARDSDTGNPNR